MRIQELLEQTIEPQPAGIGGKMPTTKPTEPPPNTSNTPKPPPTATPVTTSTSSTPAATQPDIKVQTTVAAQQKDLDDLKNQLSTLQDMMAKQVQVLSSAASGQS